MRHSLGRKYMLDFSRLSEELNSEKYMWSVCLYSSAVLPILISLSVSGYCPHLYMHMVVWRREVNGSFDLEELVF